MLKWTEKQRGARQESGTSSGCGPGPRGNLAQSLLGRFLSRAFSSELRDRQASGEPMIHSGSREDRVPGAVEAVDPHGPTEHRVPSPMCCQMTCVSPFSLRMPGGGTVRSVELATDISFPCAKAKARTPLSGDASLCSVLQAAHPTGTQDRTPDSWAALHVLTLSRSSSHPPRPLPSALALPASEATADKPVG